MMEEELNQLQKELNQLLEERKKIREEMDQQRQMKMSELTYLEKDVFSLRHFMTK
jgi:uncharacterized protein YlxW (UPF0749 family)